MKMRKWTVLFVALLCFLAFGAFSSNKVQAKKITSLKQAEKKALKEVKKAVITKSETEHENGTLYYEVELRKGSRHYDLMYRASDGKLYSYGWEEKKLQRNTKSIISKSKCKKLAKKKVANGKILSLSLKIDDGITVYKVKMKKGSKKYTLEYHAGTGKLLEYEWDIVKTSSKSSSKYIGTSKAKQIAKKRVPGARIIKVELDRDDGVTVYEVEMVKGAFEYDLKIHAKTGKIIEYDKDYMD